MSDSKKIVFKAFTKSGPKEIVAIPVGEFLCVHEAIGKEGFVVSHCASGFGVTPPLVKERSAIAVAEKVAHLPEWKRVTRKSDEPTDIDFPADARDFLREKVSDAYWEVLSAS